MRCLFDILEVDILLWLEMTKSTPGMDTKIASIPMRLLIPVRKGAVLPQTLAQPVPIISILFRQLRGIPGWDSMCVLWGNPVSRLALFVGQNPVVTAVELLDRTSIALH
jgi:hypothetical protein